MKKTLLTGVFIISTISIIAQANWLDNSFANSGVFYQDSMYMPCMLIQRQDQKIVLAGNSVNSDYSQYYYSLLRLNVDGSIDSSFGVNGYSKDSAELFPGYIYWVQTYSIAQQQDDKILVAGTAGGYDNFQDILPYVTWLLRYDSNGIIDSSFGTNGVVVTHFDSIWPQSIPNILVGAGGKIFLTGLYSITYPVSTPVSDYRVICYDSLGKIDSTYGDYGRAYVSTGQLGYIYSSTLQTDQKMLLGGADTTGTIFSIVRYTADGFIDSAFGNNGIARINCDLDMGGFNNLYLQSDSSIIATKYENAQPDSTGNFFKLSRFTPIGAVDNTFGLSGCAQAFVPSGVSIGRPGIGGANFAAEYPDGKIIVAGMATNDTLIDPPINFVSIRFVFAFVRFLPNGIVDSSFGNDGIVLSPFIINTSNNTPTMSGFSLLSNGEFIATGGGQDLDKFLAYANNTGIKNIDANTIAVSPNPTSDKLYINTSFTDFSISIYDMTGRILDLPISKNEIDVSALPSGVYCLRIQDSSGSVVRKFVKE